MTTVRSFTFFSDSRMNGSLSGKAPSAPGSQYPGAMPCGKKMPTKRGLGVAASVAARATDAGSIASSSGKPSVHPALLRNVRRGTCRFVMNIGLLRSLASVPCAGVNGCRRWFGDFHIHLERLAVHDAHHEGGEAVLIAHRVPRDRAYQWHVLVLDTASERVHEQFSVTTWTNCVE